MSKTATRLRAYLVGLAALLVFGAILAVPAWSAHPGTPDKVVFMSNRDGDQDIYTMDQDGSNVTNLTNNTVTDKQPTAGLHNQIAFVSNRDGNEEIYVMDFQGSNVTRLTNNADKDNNPTFNRTGTTVGFDRLHSDGNIDVYEVPVNTPESSSNPVTGIATSLNLEEHPSYGPGGLIVFDRTINATARMVVRDRVANTTTTLGLEGTTTTDEWDADVSPDGSRLLYVKGKGTASEIKSMNIDGTDRQLLISDVGVQNTKPAYNPDGESIMYSAKVGTDENELYNAPITGATQQTDLQSNMTENAANDNQAEYGLVDPNKTVIDEMTILPDATDGDYDDVDIWFSKDSGASATYQCQLDGGGWSNCSNPVSYNDVPTGVEHTFEVKGTMGGVTEAPVEGSWFTPDEPDEVPEEIG